MEVSLRPSEASDDVAMASWISEAAAALRWAGPRLPFPFAAADLQALLAVPGGGERSDSLVDASGTPCGFGQHWVMNPGAVHLGRVIVALWARGRGLGRVLCQQLVTAGLRTTLADTVTLRVYRDNVLALSLYASLGFREVAADSTDEVLFMSLASDVSATPGCRHD